jgi:hypothetical protein
VTFWGRSDESLSDIFLALKTFLKALAFFFPYMRHKKPPFSKQEFFMARLQSMFMTINL